MMNISVKLEPVTMQSAFPTFTLSGPNGACFGSTPAFPTFSNLPLPPRPTNTQPIPSLKTEGAMKTQTQQFRVKSENFEDFDEELFDMNLPEGSKMDLKTRRKLRKMNREKQKRSKLNDKFDQLSKMLQLTGNTRIEKLTILSKATAVIAELKAEQAELLKGRDALKDEIQRHPNSNGRVRTRSSFVHSQTQKNFTAASISEAFHAKSEPVPMPVSVKLEKIDTSFSAISPMPSPTKLSPAPKINNSWFPVNPSANIIGSTPKKTTSWDDVDDDTSCATSTKSKKLESSFEVFDMDMDTQDDLDSQDSYDLDEFDSQAEDFDSTEDMPTDVELLNDTSDFLAFKFDDNRSADRGLFRVEPLQMAF